jgi:hypothetical protein
VHDAPAAKDDLPGRASVQQPRHFPVWRNQPQAAILGDGDHGCTSLSPTSPTNRRQHACGPNADRDQTAKETVANTIDPTLPVLLDWTHRNRLGLNSRADRIVHESPASSTLDVPGLTRGETPAATRLPPDLAERGDGPGGWRTNRPGVSGSPA